MRKTVVAAIALGAALASAAAAQTSSPAGAQPPHPPSVGTGVVFFGRGRTALDAEAAAILDHMITPVPAGTARVRLSGHSDRSGPDGVNMRLSRARAESVRRHLVARGVRDECIEAEAFGESRPAVPTADGVDEPQNRRVEFAIAVGCGP